MHVLAAEFDLHLPACRSLKEKRQVLRPLLDGARQRFRVSIAETAHQEQWQRAALGVAVVSASASQAEEWLDDLERFVWSRPDVEVLDAERQWMEFDR